MALIGHGDLCVGVYPARLGEDAAVVEYLGHGVERDRDGGDEEDPDGDHHEADHGEVAEREVKGVRRGEGGEGSSLEGGEGRAVRALSWSRGVTGRGVTGRRAAQASPDDTGDGDEHDRRNDQRVHGTEDGLVVGVVAGDVARLEGEGGLSK